MASVFALHSSPSFMFCTVNVGGFLCPSRTLCHTMKHQVKSLSSIDHTAAHWLSLHWSVPRGWGEAWRGMCHVSLPWNRQKTRSRLSVSPLRPKQLPPLDISPSEELLLFCELREPQEEIWEGKKKMLSRYNLHLQKRQMVGNWHFKCFFLYSKNAKRLINYEPRLASQSSSPPTPSHAKNWR